ncbi:predicted protein [Chaetomium globosum CBS 148.51]|uniref:Uncharacterized protein n=1 Tax=Chaetomium globosum (strain ATCC 6205 / CBS 148.51 / DSM 1962 / NBRC 6347 / NRRL 1970) TaxID=306901 RepID=Q2H8J1_CHAGB|nr:uncharacterized protein CHGG_03463 [Chaetomium globosum CBS 148.51]EAQ91528.1 predicted protein [Chaetomium globosum CBS 148.51]
MHATSITQHAESVIQTAACSFLRLDPATQKENHTALLASQNFVLARCAAYNLCGNNSGDSAPPDPKTRSGGEARSCTTCHNPFDQLRGFKEVVHNWRAMTTGGGTVKSLEVGIFELVNENDGYLPKTSHGPGEEGGNRTAPCDFAALVVDREDGLGLVSESGALG